jgi:hypothetical protein
MSLVGRVDRRRVSLYSTFLVIFFIFFVFLIYRPARHDSPAADGLNPSGSASTLFPPGNHAEPLNLSSVRSKYAYATFLAIDADEDSGIGDEYFIATRVLAYQLLHAPGTRTHDGIPFIVVVNKDVPETKRDRLRRWVKILLLVPSARTDSLQ